MSRFIIDVSRLVARRLRQRLPTGIDRVGLAYIRHYGPRARAALTLGSRAFVLPLEASQQVFERLVAADSTTPFRRTVISAALRADVLPNVAGQWFLNTGHTGLHRPGYEAMLTSLGVRPVHVIHDLIPISHPQFCRAPESTLHRQRISLALRSARALICNSQATFDDLAEFAMMQGQPIPPATTALLATGSEDRSRQALVRPEHRLGEHSIAPSRVAPAHPSANRPYFLMVGTIEPRKNHLLILQVWQRLVRQIGDTAPLLVLIGQSGWECEHVDRLLERAPELRGHVLRITGCPDADLARWMAGARALLFPSFAEGFGLPVLEALEAGVPVIAANLPVYREFAGDLPEYLDPLDAAGWQAAIAAYSNPGDRRRLRRIEALAGYCGPTWAAHFARVDDLLARIDAVTIKPAARVPVTADSGLD